MIIHRITGQKRKTLLEFYEPRENQLESAQVALRGIQALLRRLAEIDGPELFAFTSHYRLNFVTTDSHSVPVIARVVPGCTSDTDEPLSSLFHISYPTTPDAGRDDRTWAFLTAESVPGAVECLSQAFRKSPFSPYSSD